MPLFKRLSILLFASLAALVARAELLPVQYFFKTPDRLSITLSPSGRYLSALARNDAQRLNVLIVDRLEKKNWWATNERDTDVVSYFWKTDDTLLFELGAIGRDAEDGGGLFSIRRDGRDLQVMIPSFRMRTGEITFRNHDVFARLLRDPENILITTDQNGVQGYPDVYRQRVGRQARKLVVKNPGNVIAWIADRRGIVRAGVREEKKGMAYSVIWRESEDAEWQVLATNSAEVRGWWPAGFSQDGRTMYVFSNVGRSTAALVEYDPSTRAFGRVLHEDPVYDVGASSFLLDNFTSQLIYSREQGLIGVRYAANKTRTVWFAEPYQTLQRELDLAMPETVNNITPLEGDANLFLVTASSSRDPGTFYLLNGRTFELATLAASRPWVDPKKLAETKPVSFPARDGHMLHGYLTLPVGSSGQKLPFILHPHGGPYGPRDEYRFDPQVQFLANRGYAVLQVDYRGSGGYGFDHYFSGRHQIGYTMLDDKVDAVKWAQAQGIADPARTGIFGASYGGYASMAGAAYYPDLFKFAINYVGVVDFRKHILQWKRQKNEVGYNYWVYMVGDPEADRDALAKISPINFVDRIKGPLMIVHGRIDPVVSVDQADALRSALDKAGVRYTYHVANDEGHGFRKEENNYHLFTAIDEFLNRLIPAGKTGATPLRVIEMPAKEKN